VSAVKAVNPLNHRIDFFDKKVFDAAPRSLKEAVAALEQAQQSFMGVEALALVLHADDMQRDSGEAGMPLKCQLREGLNLALVHLANHSGNVLSEFADTLRRIYELETKAEVQSSKKGSK
jgi:hypothetical protein